VAQLIEIGALVTGHLVCDTCAALVAGRRDDAAMRAMRAVTAEPAMTSAAATRANTSTRSCSS
jgi:hypothetical protein